MLLRDGLICRELRDLPVNLDFVFDRYPETP